MHILRLLENQQKDTAHQRLTARARRAPGKVLGGTEPEAVRVRLLGGFGVSVGSRTIEENSWRLKKAGSLIKLLALARGHRLHREQLMDALWTDLARRSQADNLHRNLHVAREMLEATPANAVSRYLPLRGDVLELCPDSPLWVDVEAFESAAATARRNREPAAYRAAVDLYAGDMLPGDRYEAWAEVRREGLRLTYLELLLELAGLHEERGEHGPGIEALRQVLAEEPSHEEAHAGLMRLLALRGGRGEAILQYERLRKVLSREFGAEPGPAIRRLYEEIRAGTFPTSPSPSAGRRSEECIGSSSNNLPTSLTSFVGRERETLEVKRLLSMTRLLTLTGAGGCGKTGLALEIARNLVGTYPDGIWLVELAALSKPELVPQAVATALDVPEQAGRLLEDTLADHLRRRDLLLVLDNCEHLVDGAARLAEALLSVCPKLRILATSRESLGVPGEAVWTVPPLSLPDADGESTVESLIRFEAVRLFVDRARSRLPAFDLTDKNAASTASVCLKLDGIPLAIELATARMGALAVEQVAERLEDSLGLLTGGARTADPRQQTMRATLAWSHELLSGPEKVLFGRLSAFAGGWTLEAAEEVCQDCGAASGAAGRDNVLDLLSRLVDKSLVVAEASSGDGGVRYRMLEPVRQYGEERLEASGEADVVRRRHASWYLELAKGAEPWLRGARQEVWLERLEREHDNLRAALRRALERGEAELGDTAGAAAALSNLAWAAFLGNDLERASALTREAVTLERSLRDIGGVARALLILGMVAVARRDHERAVALHEESLALARKAGDGLSIAVSLGMGAFASLGRGDNRRARALCEEGLALSQQPRVMNVTAFHLHAAAALASSQGRPARSARLWGAAQSLREAIGTILSPVELHAYRPYIDAARMRLEEAAWEEAWAEGKAMTVEEAVGYALGAPEGEE